MLISVTEWSGVGGVRGHTVHATNAPAVAVQVKDVVLSCIFHYSGTNTAQTPPTGYTGLNPMIRTNFVNMSAYRTIDTTGTEDPAWPGNHGEITIALQPKAG